MFKINAMFSFFLSIGVYNTFTVLSLSADILYQKLMDEFEDKQFCSSNQY